MDNPTSKKGTGEDYQQKVLFDCEAVKIVRLSLTGQPEATPLVPLTHIRGSVRFLGKRDRGAAYLPNQEQTCVYIEWAQATRISDKLYFYIFIFMTPIIDGSEQPSNNSPKRLRKDGVVKGTCGSLILESIAHFQYTDKIHNNYCETAIKIPLIKIVVVF